MATLRRADREDYMIVAANHPPVIAAGIPTALVAERYKAGESIDELAEDYGRSRKEIEEAIRASLARSRLNR